MVNGTELSPHPVCSRRESRPDSRRFSGIGIADLVCTVIFSALLVVSFTAATLAQKNVGYPIQPASATKPAPSPLVPADLNTSYISPEVLNTHVVFSRRCSKIVYSSNRNGDVRPIVVDLNDPIHPQTTTIKINEAGDFIAQSLASDCRMLAMVSDRNGNGSFEIYLYDLKRQTLKNITNGVDLDEGTPIFAPRAQMLAFLSGDDLCLYDYLKATRLKVAATPLTFKSLVWSENGDSLYLEDQTSNIWEYLLRPRLFRRIWSAPRLSYAPHAISQHDRHLLFASDHESDYSQIYQLDLDRGRLKRLYNSPYDQHSPFELDTGHYTFRTVMNASFIAAEVNEGKYRSLSPLLGVVYDLSLDFGVPLFLYSNDRLPTSLYWIRGDQLTPLIPTSYRSQQPNAVPVRNADGITNFLYVPSKEPKAWLIWLHGGPHEQVSPRFNLYFDFLARRNIAVYAINYPGSTGAGNSYALNGENVDEMLKVQLPAVERDLKQLRRLHPEASTFFLVGVSYGSILAHLLAAKHPEVTGLVDFSGVADSNRIGIDSSNRFYPPMFVLYGTNDFALKNPARTELISRYEAHAKVSRLILPNEGHFIENRGDIDEILRGLEAFLEPLCGPKRGS